MLRTFFDGGKHESKGRSSRFSRTVLGLSVIIFLSSLTGFAQTGTTTIRGIVKDPQGNVVSGAKVTVSNATKNFSRTQVPVTMAVIPLPPWLRTPIR